MRQETILDQVITVVQAKLQDDSLRIEATTSLQDLRSFDSLVVVSVLEALESDLGLEIDPALILPETFATPLTLADALVQSAKSA